MITSDDSLPREQTLALALVARMGRFLRDRCVLRLSLRKRYVLLLRFHGGSSTRSRGSDEVAGPFRITHTPRRDTSDLCHQRLLVTNHQSIYLKSFCLTNQKSTT